MVHTEVQKVHRGRVSGLLALFGCSYLEFAAQRLSLCNLLHECRVSHAIFRPACSVGGCLGCQDGGKVQLSSHETRLSWGLSNSTPG